MDTESERRITAAIAEWESERVAQQDRALAAGRAQQGSRSAVTGGTHLEGFNELLLEEIASFGVTGLTWRTNRSATVAGYYRSSKSWDLLVLQDGRPRLVVEYKSMVGSTGNNLNNRADEVFGIAEDARAAEEHGLLPVGIKRAYVYLMGVNQKSIAPVRIGQIVGKADQEFDGASYLRRCAIMCRRIRERGLYSMTLVLGVHLDPLYWGEPDDAVGWDRFVQDLRTAFD